MMMVQNETFIRVEPSTTPGDQNHQESTDDPIFKQECPEIKSSDERAANHDFHDD